MSNDLCPWLGTELDREIRHAEPTEGHLCYAQKEPAEIELEHQSWYCLTSEHRGCRFYRKPLDMVVSPSIEPDEVEDEIGPVPAPFPALRVGLWIVAVLALVAVIYYYASALWAAPSPPTPTNMPVAVQTPQPSVTSGPVPSPSGALNTPPPAFEFVNPTATPTPYPGGAVYSLAPETGAAGWVASDESRGNHLGDSYLYTGVFDKIIYHGALQFDLSAVPRGATIHSAALTMTGLDVRRLGSSGTWEMRILTRDADVDWNRKTYQDIHNAPVQWSLPPALGVGDLGIGVGNTFALSAEQLRDLEQRLLEEHYTVSFRIDGPLAGDNSVFAWDTGYGPATQGNKPRLVISVGAPPKTPIPTGSPPPTNTSTPTETPVYVIISSTPTPENLVTAAAIAARVTAWAETTGTATPLPQYWATPTPRYIVITNTPQPETYATAVYQQALATANVFLTGTPTPRPPNLATVTSTPRPTRTPVVIWLDEMRGTATPTLTPSPTPSPVPPIPSVLRNKIAFFSDRGGEPALYILEPDTKRIGLLTDRWPYDQAVAQERIAPDGEYRAAVSSGGGGVQIYVQQLATGITWAVTFGDAVSYDPVWSPKGDLIAYVSQEMGPSGGSDDIFTVNPQGQNKQRLTFNTWEWDKHPTFSPDGSQIVFWSNQETGRQQLWIMNADGSDRRLLLESPYNDWDPVWIK